MPRHQELTAEALELLETRKQLPAKFRDELTEQNCKFCTSCQTVQELNQFRLSATSKSGRAGRCFSCHPEQVKVSQRDFSIDPTEFVLARSLASLRRQSRRNRYPVETFGVTEFLSYHGIRRNEVSTATMTIPAKGFTLPNIAPSKVQDDDNNND